jgi:hypothetical protein
VIHLSFISIGHPYFCASHMFESADSGMRRSGPALPEFRALEEFEWIGYPELQADMVQVKYC